MGPEAVRVVFSVLTLAVVWKQNELGRLWVLFGNTWLFFGGFPEFVWSSLASNNGSRDN